MPQTNGLNLPTDLVSRSAQPLTESAAQPLNKDGTTRIQSVNGTSVYCGRACDRCILAKLKEIAMEQASPTTKTIAEAKMLTDYLHTYPHVVIRYYASNIRLQIASDPAYLVLLKAKRRAAVHYHLGWRNSYRTHGAVDVLCQTIKIVVSSSPEAEMGDPSTWAGNMPAPYMQPLKNLAINSHPPDPLSKPTTAPPKASSIPKCTKKSSQVFQHALLVDERQNQARPIQSHLGPWQTLLDKHENSDKANPRNREPRCIYTIEY
jgi:hypothetical protein